MRFSRRAFTPSAQLLISYSGDAIYRYDILADPEAGDVVPPTVSGERPPQSKRKRSSAGDTSDQVRKRATPPLARSPSAHSSAPPVALTSGSRAPAALTTSEKRLRKRVARCLDLSDAVDDDVDPVNALAALDAMDVAHQAGATACACRTYAQAMLGFDPPADLAALRASAREAVERDGWDPVRPPRPPPPGPVNYEVSIGEDGELQVVYDQERPDGDEASDDEGPMYMEPTTALDEADDDGVAMSEDQEEEEEDDDDGDDDDYVDRIQAMRRREAGVHAGVPVVLPLAKYDGHRNIDTVKDVNFLGARDDVIVSGSDDGRWFAWDKRSGDLRGLWTGDSSVVNVMKGHPHLPGACHRSSSLACALTRRDTVCAVSGIDDTVRNCHLSGAG
jgi:hypothetical protein